MTSEMALRLEVLADLSSVYSPYHVCEVASREPVWGVRGFFLYLI